MNNNPKGAKNPKKPLIFYYAVMLLVLMMLNWLLFPSLLQRQVTEVGYDVFISMVDDHKLGSKYSPVTGFFSALPAIHWLI